MKDCFEFIERNNRTYRFLAGSKFDDMPGPDPKKTREVTINRQALNLVGAEKLKEVEPVHPLIGPKEAISRIIWETIKIGKEGHPMAELNVDLIKEFAELDGKKGDLQAELNRITKRLTEIDPIIQEQMVTAGVDNLKVNGRTVFIRKDIFAKISSKEEAIKALKEAGLTDLLFEGYNTNTLSAYIRELINEGEELPEAFGEAILANEKFSVRSVKS